MRSVLVVCVGNICRSPMAEALLRERLDGCDVSSAGLSALIGHQADPHAVELMGKRGIDISAHRARQLLEQTSKQSDLILVMESNHRRAIEEQYPCVRGRVFRIGHFRDQDVDDPYKQSRNVFESSLTLIEQGVDDWVQRIRKIG